MLNQYLLILLLVLSSWSKLVWAWDAHGHQLINQIAYENLSSAEQKKIDLILTSREIYLPRAYAHANLSNFAKLGPLPDRWRNLNLQQIFRRLDIDEYHADPQFTRQVSKNWHFEDVFYSTPEHCHLPQHNLPHAQQALAKLAEIYWANPQNYPVQAVCLIFLSHIIADLHQPLHTISRINSACQSDYGGNHFCLAFTASRHCKLSLHQLWDREGFWLKNADILGLARQYAHAMHEPNQDLSPKNWLQENGEFYTFIYHTQENALPSADYLTQTQQISQQRIELAGQRLAAVLKILLNENAKPEKLSPRSRIDRQPTTKFSQPHL